MDEITSNITSILNYEQTHNDKSWTVDDIDASVVPLLQTFLKYRLIEKKNGGRMPQFHTTGKAGVYLQRIDIQKEEATIPPNLFDAIIGLDDVKRLIYRALYATEPVHIFIVGDYSSAKSTILFCLERLPNSLAVDSALATKIGVGKLLEQYKPSFLLMDEFDKMKSDDYNVLLTVMASQRYIRTTSKGQVNVAMPTRVFAAGNSKNVPESILKRFDPFIIELAEYSRNDAIHVMQNILKQREIDNDMASYISQAVVDSMDGRNPRAALNIASTCHTKEQVDETVEVLMKHKHHHF